MKFTLSAIIATLLLALPAGAQITNPAIVFVPSITVTIAASNSRNASSAQVQCTGSNDGACINNAMATYCPSTATQNPSGCTVTLLDGTYNISSTNPVTITDANITLRGTHRVMWGGYNNSQGGSCTGGPCVGIVGTSGAILKAADTAITNLVQIVPTVPCGTGIDTTRCRGITIENLYIVGNAYHSVGVSSATSNDWIVIRNNNFQKLAQCMQVYSDSGRIYQNNCQDNGTPSGTHGQIDFAGGAVYDNLIWDNNGGAIHSWGAGNANTAIYGNNIGDWATYGIDCYGFCAITGNTLGNSGSQVLTAIKDETGTSSMTIVGNEIFGCGTADCISLVNSGGTNVATVVGNTFINPSATANTGYALHTSGVKALSACGNTASGTGAWTNGTYNITGFTPCAN